MAVCDVNCFTMIDIGQYWSNNDSGVLSRKEMGKRWNLQVKCISLKPIVPQAFQFDLFIFFMTRCSYWKTGSCICILTKCYRKTNPFTIIETLVQDVTWYWKYFWHFSGQLEYFQYPDKCFGWNCWKICKGSCCVA